MTHVTPPTILTAAAACALMDSMTHTPNTDAGSLYVGDTVYMPDTDTIEQVENLQWVGSAYAQDVMVLTTDLSVRTVRFGTPMERISRTHRRFAA